jgi:ubiquitin-conjugating enzyme E2 J2
MSSRACLARLRKEVINFDPPPYIRAAPLENNLQEWHYVLQGPPDSPYEGGMYHGKLKFPDDFPFKPPSIFMLTPNGRYETGRRLCLSISDFHPETWVPTWSVSSILNGVLSFMLEDSPSTGCIQTSVAERQRLRGKTAAFNANDPIFCKLFPELVGGALFTDPTSGGSAGDPTSASAPAPVLQSLRPLADALPPSGAAAASGEADGEEDDGADDKAPGKNAAKNKKARERKARQKAAAAPVPDDEPTGPGMVEDGDTSGAS